MALWGLHPFALLLGLQCLHLWNFCPVGTVGTAFICPVVGTAVSIFVGVSSAKTMGTASVVVPIISSIGLSCCSRFTTLPRRAAIAESVDDISLVFLSLFCNTSS